VVIDDLDLIYETIAPLENDAPLLSRCSARGTCSPPWDFRQHPKEASTETPVVARPEPE